ncbi:MAG: hypothetical protein K6A65_06145, partial [Succinivibrionaceae bacterium]|nr:hypothetical protein [Succinivibrionaceae bacterium]
MDNAPLPKLRRQVALLPSATLHSTEDGRGALTFPSALPRAPGGALGLRECYEEDLRGAAHLRMEVGGQPHEAYLMDDPATLAALLGVADPAAAMARQDLPPREREALVPAWLPPAEDDFLGLAPGTPIGEDLRLGTLLQRGRGVEIWAAGRSRALLATEGLFGEWQRHHLIDEQPFITIETPSGVALHALPIEGEGTVTRLTPRFLLTGEEEAARLFGGMGNVVANAHDLAPLADAILIAPLWLLLPLSMSGGADYREQFMALLSRQEGLPGGQPPAFSEAAVRALAARLRAEAA